MNHGKSEKQNAARRENAKKSTGPKSAAGKSCASQNARKHGLTSEKVGIEFMEGKAELDAHRNSILAYYNPQNPMEMYWADQIVLAQWRTKQLARWESGIFNDAVNRTWEDNTDQEVEGAEDLEQYITNIEPREKYTTQNWMISYGMSKLMNKKDYLSIFLRYQSQADRMIRRAEDAIAKLRNEAENSRQRTDSQSTSAPKNEPDSAPSPSPSASQPAPMPQ